MKNATDKPIRTISFALGSLKVDRDIGDPFGRTGLLAPGASERVWIGPYEEHYPPGKIPPPNWRDLRIVAAVFGDGTSDGDPQAIARLDRIRTGKRRNSSASSR